MKSPVLAFTLFALAVATSASAQDANVQKAMQKAQFMLRQATAEKTELQTQVAELKQQVDKLTRELDAAKSGSAAAQQRTEQKYSSAIAQWQRRDGEVSAQLAATREQLQQQIAQHKAAQTQLQAAANNFSACYENNKKLYAINRQLLLAYERKGFGDVLRQREPFTGVAQVEVENLVQEYRYQLDELQVNPAQNQAQ